MPTIGIDTYTINFSILEDIDPKTLSIIDRSNYLSIPEKPLLFITFPGFTGHIEIPYSPKSLIILNSDSLGITEQCDYSDLADLPDGIYQIRMGVCPYDELYSRQCYLKTSQLDCRFQNLLLTYKGCYCLDEKELEKQIVELDILIESAKAEINKCNIDKATSKYNTALNKINNLEKKLNCK